jgi:hypothetical protein
MSAPRSQPDQDSDDDLGIVRSDFLAEFVAARPAVRNTIQRWLALLGPVPRFWRLAR